MKNLRFKLSPLTIGLFLLLLLSFLYSGESIEITLVPVCLADSFVGGAVSGVWEAQYSPFLAYDSIWVPAGDALIIEPGVIVKFASTGLGMSVYGTLIAEGIEGDSITFTTTSASPTKGIWNGINFSGPQSSPSSLRYCKVIWGQKAFRLQNSSPHFAHCRLFNCLEQGIWAQNTTLTIDTCEIFSNDQSGIVIVEGNPVIRGCYSHDNFNKGFYLETLNGGIITGNQCSYNGDEGIFCYDDCNETEISYNIISYNTDYGIRIDGCNVSGHPIHIEHNQIFHNYLDGVYSDVSNVRLINNTITQNDRDGVFAYSSSLTLYNNIIDRNDHRGIYMQSVVLTINYNDVWSNTTADYLGCNPGYSDISEDPEYVDFYNDDYHLMEGSPCIDTGNPSLQYNDPDSTRNDMGALYFNQSGINRPGPGAQPQSFALMKAYPNPFNSSTVIEIEPLKGQLPDGSLIIYDIMGRKVYDFKIDIMNGGRYRWDGRDYRGNILPAGVYFCRIGKVDILKLMLLK